MMDRRSFLTFLLATASAAAFGVSPQPVMAAASERADNAIFLSNGGGVRDYPMRLARPFVEGEIASAPQAVIDGTPVPTQADVKTRWPDGSVKHAVLSFIVPRISGRTTVSFQNQTAGANVALTPAQMLDPALDFDAAMQIYRGDVNFITTARKMLEDGNFTVWCAGPIATTIVLADHSAARKYDIGFDDLRSIRPIFHVTFWPTLRKIHVRAIAEISNTEALTDIGYGVRLFGGARKPTETFRQDAVPHTAGTRWTRTYWIGGDPSANVNIDHNLNYLTRTMAFPNFDTSVQVPGNVISTNYNNWLKTPRYLYGDGGWYKDMGTTGGRSDIGHVTCAQAFWLYTGDAYTFDMVSKQADLAGAWPLHVREGDGERWYDSDRKVRALGKPVSVFARPRLWLFDDREKNARDQLVVHGERLIYGGTKSPWGGWRPDAAHQPDPYSALYTLTGDYFALEQLQFWAGATVVKYDPNYKGPPPSGAVMDQVRGNAWGLRSRTSAAFLSPDGTPEKAYFAQMLNHMMAFWEGRYGIRGTSRENSPQWKHGNDNFPFRSPLHFAHDQRTPGTGPNSKSVGYSSALWQHYMLIFELGIAKEKGYDAGPLLTYIGRVLTAQFEEPGYSFYNVQQYWTGTRDINGKFFETWTETLRGYDDVQPEVIKTDIRDGYAAYAYGASTMLTKEPGGIAAYNWLRKTVYDPLHRNYGTCPKWAYLPRA